MRTAETRERRNLDRELGGTVQPNVMDVEGLKKQARKLAAARVLAGDSADVTLDLGQLRGCQVRIAAGYGSLSRAPEAIVQDRLIWILDGYAEIEDAAGRVTNVSQGESIVLSGGKAYRLVFPHLSIYLRVEAEEQG
jgi:hypothetical protein